jgi:cell division protein FtsZ
MGLALMGSATASGENRAVEAAQKAISSPLLEDISIQGARGVLINVTGGADLGVHEINEAASMIQEEADDDANIIFGAVIDENLNDEIRITVIATGFVDHKEEQRPLVVNLAPIAPPPPQKNKKVVHLGTIVDDLEAPTWQRRKQGTDETEKVTLNNATFQMNKNEGEEDAYDVPTFLRRQID